VRDLSEFKFRFFYLFLKVEDIVVKVVDLLPLILQLVFFLLHPLPQLLFSPLKLLKFIIQILAN
jgi:hypothetical protein